MSGEPAAPGGNTRHYISVQQPHVGGLEQGGRGCWGLVLASLSSQPDIVLQWASALLTRPSRFRFQVVFGKKLPAFTAIPIHQLQHEKKYDIYFADGKVFALYR